MKQKKSSQQNATTENASKSAEEVTIAEPSDELFIDLDSERALKQFRKRFVIFLNICKRYSISLCGADEMKPTTSKSANHYHVIVLLHGKFSPAKRNAIRSFLGSDPIREMHNFCRTEAKRPLPVVFFERVKP